MSLNCNEINAVLSELDLAGAFVQDVVQPGFDSLALYTFKPGAPRTVFISLAAGACRIHEVRRKITRNEKPLRFYELLKSRIKGARISACAQVGFERVIKVSLEKAGAVYVMPAAQEHLAKKSRAPAESGAETYTLYVRLWSNAANIFLCDENDTIIDSFYRRPAKGEMPGETFALPAPGGRNPVEFAVRDFAELPPREDGRERSFNEKVDCFYSTVAAQSSLESLLAQAQKWHETHASRLSAAIARLEEKRTEFLGADSLRHSGDLILANAHKISGDANFIECDDWDTGGTVRIRIDAQKSAHENAQDYYARYKKAAGGLDALEHDIAIAKKELAGLDAQYAAMCAEQNPVRLEQVLRRTQRPKQQEKKAHPGLEYDVDGWRILVGRDANENDELLRHHVKGSDLWLHVRDWQGGYVFVKFRAGKTVPLEILLYAGNLAVYWSKARKNGAADLYYTQVKHLRRAKDAPKGTVLPTNEKNLFIKLDESRLRRLEDIQKGME